MENVDTTLKQHFLNFTEAQIEPQVKLKLREQRLAAENRDS